MFPNFVRNTELKDFTLAKFLSTGNMPPVAPVRIGSYKTNQTPVLRLLHFLNHSYNYVLQNCSLLAYYGSNVLFTTLSQVTTFPYLTLLQA